MRLAAVTAASAAAVLLPGEPLGVGVTLVFALVAITAATTVRPTFDALVFGGLALPFATLPMIRDAGWVVGLDLSAAWLLAAAAVSGPTLVAPLAPLIRLRELPGLAPSTPPGAPPVVRGAVLGSVLLIPFAALFLTADAAFAEVAQSVPHPSAASLPGRMLAFALVLCVAAGLALSARRPFQASMPRVPRRLTPWEWGIALVLLDALFLAFVVVQLAVLFGGHEHVLRTAGLTYAEYARQGFWQLLAAAALTFVVVGAAALVAHAPKRSHQLILRVLLGILCVLTIVVVASALRRLTLYEEAFGLTRLRLLAEAISLWFGGLFALLVASGLIPHVRRQLPRIAIAGTAVVLLTFSFVNPDGLIAERNIERWRDTGRLDVAYLQKLSADAAPALAELPPALRDRALAPLAVRLQKGEPWSSFNLSRDRARSQLAGEAVAGAQRG
jgi:hypothetical protein